MSWAISSREASEPKSRVFCSYATGYTNGYQLSFRRYEPRRRAWPGRIMRRKGTHPDVCLCSWCAARAVRVYCIESELALSSSRTTATTRARCDSDPKRRVSPREPIRDGSGREKGFASSCRIFYPATPSPNSQKIRKKIIKTIRIISFATRDRPREIAQGQG